MAGDFPLSTKPVNGGKKTCKTNRHTLSGLPVLPDFHSFLFPVDKNKKENREEKEHNATAKRGETAAKAQFAELICVNRLVNGTPLLVDIRRAVRHHHRRESD